VEEGGERLRRCSLSLVVVSFGCVRGDMSKRSMMVPAQSAGAASQGSTSGPAGPQTLFLFLSSALLVAASYQ